MKEPLVSIIVTTFNRENYLKECISHILSQTYKNFEIIIVDNFSDYDIKNYLKLFKDDRIKLIQNDNNGKYVVNRNIGIKSSKGYFITFCDDDDIWYPKNLKSKIEYLTKNSSIGMITSKEEIIDSFGYKTGKTTNSWINKTHFVTFKDFYFKNAGSPSAAILRKDCFNEIGYFDESNSKKNIEDIDFWLKLSLKYKILYLNKILGACRMHSGNVSYLDDTQILNSYLLRKNLLLEKNNEISSFYMRAKYHIVKLKIKIILFYLKQRRLSNSLKWFIKLFKD